MAEICLCAPMERLHVESLHSAVRQQEPAGQIIIGEICAQRKEVIVLQSFAHRERVLQIPFAWFHVLIHSSAVKHGRGSTLVKVGISFKCVHKIYVVTVFLALQLGRNLTCMLSGVHILDNGISVCQIGVHGLCCLALCRLVQQSAYLQAQVIAMMGLEQPVGGQQVGVVERCTHWIERWRWHGDSTKYAVLNSCVVLNGLPVVNLLHYILSGVVVFVH